MLRAALFIDAANVFYSEKTMGWKIDFTKVYEYFNKHFALYNAFYYSAEPQENEEEKRQEYRDFCLQGFTMRLKQLKEIRDSKGKIVLKKANLDIEMVVDMFATQQNYDIAVLFTGDSDFTRAVELLRMNGKQIFVLSTKGHSGIELINASDKFMDLQDLKESFLKKEEPAKKTPNIKNNKNKPNDKKNTPLQKKQKKIVTKVQKKQVKPKNSAIKKMPTKKVVEATLKKIREKNKKLSNK